MPVVLSVKTTHILVQGVIQTITYTIQYALMLVHMKNISKTMWLLNVFCVMTIV